MEALGLGDPRRLSRPARNAIGIARTAKDMAARGIAGTHFRFLSMKLHGLESRIHEFSIPWSVIERLPRSALTQLILEMMEKA